MALAPPPRLSVILHCFRAAFAAGENRRQGQGEPEGGPLSFLTFHPDAPLVTLNELGHQVQSESESLGGLSPRATDAREAFEEARVLVRGNAWTPILHAAGHHTWRCREPHANERHRGG